MKKHILAGTACLALLLSLLSGCGAGRADTGAADDEAPDAPTAAQAAVQPQESDGAVTVIAFSGADVEIGGEGAALDDGVVRITAGGSYRLTGTSDQARVVVDADADTDDVTVILDGCRLACADDETIYFKSARSARVICAELTKNIVMSGTGPAADGTSGNADEDASGAALRAKCPLTIDGGGELTVLGYINNGVASSGDITVMSGTLDITASNDGLKSRGDIAIDGGALTIAAEQDGIQADGVLTVTDGELSVITGGGADEGAMKTGDSAMMGGPSRGPSGESGADDTMDAWDFESEDAGSRKGLKAGSAIVITGGAFYLDTADDAVHCDGDVTIADGELTIRAGDDGIHADASLTIDGGFIDIQLSYEGLEAVAITQSDGAVRVVAKDDGLNANGAGGMFGPSAEASGETDAGALSPVIRIAGGTLTVDSGGDGLDSNGDLYIEGGTVYVSGPSTNWDAALDYGERGRFIITGGTLMAAGYSGMAEAPDPADGSQPSIWYAQSEYCADGDTVTLTDEDGSTVCQYSFAHGFNCVVISSPELTVGRTYTLDMGGRTAEIGLTDTGWSNRASGGPGGMMGRPGAEASAETTQG